LERGGGKIKKSKKENRYHLCSPSAQGGKLSTKNRTKGIKRKMGGPSGFVGRGGFDLQGQNLEFRPVKGADGAKTHLKGGPQKL